MDSDDTLEAMAICRRTYKEELEPVEVPKKPYDALVNQIAAHLMKRRSLRFRELYEMFKKAYPYRDLTIEDIQQILEYMHSRVPRFAWVSLEDKLAVKPRRSKPLYEYFFENLSMIPAEKHYLVVDRKTDAAIGLLDEAFVAEYGKPGVKFIIRGSPWKILNVTSDKIYVDSVDDPAGSVPSWVGEEIPVPFEVAQEVGSIRSFVEETMKNGLTLEEIAKMLIEKYPVDEKTALAAINETVRSVEKGYLVPTDTRTTVEDWEDFVILQANLGSLTNRALAQLLGHVISEKIGYSVAVQHDPYRIFIKTMGEVKAETVMQVIGELKNASNEFIKKTLTKASVKTGIFKRRMIHVARRFGALRKWVDFSHVSLRSLIDSFEGTIVYEEALKEVFTKDLDLTNLTKVLERMRTDEIEVLKVETLKEPTPVARVGIDRASMKTDLIPPEKMRYILLESAKARLLNETRSFICIDCWDYTELLAIKDLPDNPVCPKCGASELGMLLVEEEDTYSLIDKRGEKLTKQERKLKNESVRTAILISKWGKPAAVALSGRRLRTSDVKHILSKESHLSDHLFELIIEAERNVLKKRFL
jgi:ATP-dependent Lhr-like helicase